MVQIPWFYHLTWFRLIIQKYPPRLACSLNLNKKLHRNAPQLVPSVKLIFKRYELFSSLTFGQVHTDRLQTESDTYEPTMQHVQKLHIAGF